MYRTKEYKYFKTAKKTAKENNLAIADTKTLFDFSFMDNILVLKEWEKEVIKNDAMKNVKPYNKESLYIAMYDNFTACDGIARYNVHNVYDTHGKKLYTILELAEIEHYHKECKSIYDKYYNVNKVICHRIYNQPMTDIEI